MRLAATVMVVRPASARFEVFMLRRSESSHFVPNAYVFPGGTADEADLSERALARLYDAPSAAAQFRARPAAGSDVPIATAHEARALLFTALRELYEEAGIFFACDADGRAQPAGDTRTDFLELLEARDLHADARALTFFSQWLTPAQFTKRYNTHFFLAQLPPGSIAAADAFETHDGRWFDPLDALAKNTSGELHLVYPTIKHLERLAAFSSIGELLEFARSKPILALTPDTIESGFVLPPALENEW